MIGTPTRRRATVSKSNGWLLLPDNKSFNLLLCTIILLSDQITDSSTNIFSQKVPVTALLASPRNCVFEADGQRPVDWYQLNTE